MADEDQNLEEGVEAVDGPDLSVIPEKFGGDLGKFSTAYQELEREYHQSRQQVRGLEDSVTHLTNQWEQFVQAQNQPDPAEVEAQWENAYVQDPWNTAKAYLDAQVEQRERLAQQQTQPQQQEQEKALLSMVANYAADQMERKYGEAWTQAAPQVSELIVNNPLFQNDAFYRDPTSALGTLESAFKMVKADAGLGELAQQQVADTRQMKLNAQSATGAAGRPDSPDAGAQRWEEIMSAKSGKLDF